MAIKAEACIKDLQGPVSCQAVSVCFFSHMVQVSFMRQNILSPLKIAAFIVCLSVSPSQSTAQETEPAASNTFRLGAVLALTGPAQHWGQDSLRSMQMAAEEINQRGGINGRKIELVAEDSRTEPKMSVSAFSRLTASGTVPVVVGDVWSHLTIPLIPLADRAKVVLISPSVVPDTIENPGDHFFTLGFKPGKTRAALDLFLKLNPQISKVSVICWEDPWGNAYLQAWLSAMERHGVSLVSKTCNQVDYAHDYRTDVTKAAAHKPDALLAQHHIERILKNMKEQNFSSAVLTTSNIVEVLRDGILSWNMAEGVWFTDWPAAGDFVERFKIKYGTEPFIEAFNAYDAVYAITEAAFRSPQDILRGLKQVRRNGLAGPNDFTAGFAANNAEPGLFRVQSGRIVRVGESAR